MTRYTKGPWKRDGATVRLPRIVFTQCTPRNGFMISRTSTITSHLYDEAEANAILVASAPDRHEQIIAITQLGWTVDKVSLYDEEGIEGWMWTEPNGTEHAVIGDWSEPPGWPESARVSFKKLMGCSK